MSEWIKRGGIWVEDETGISPVLKRGGSWVDAREGWGKRAGVWHRFHQQTDPITVTYYGNKWSPTFRESGAPSGGSNRDELSYWGDGWNNEGELSMVGFRDFDLADAKAQLDLRPFILSGQVKVWVGHVFSGTQIGWQGFHGVRGAEPGAFSRLHDEKDAAWATELHIPKPPSGDGAALWTPLPPSTFDNISQGFRDETIGGMTLTAEDASGDAWWGWVSGSSYSTSNSGGSSGGLVDIRDTADGHSFLLELTIDFVGASNVSS